eukprot:747415-Hanusia_phi.AAC.13
MKLTAMNLGAVKASYASILTILVSNSSHSLAPFEAYFNQTDSIISWELIETLNPDLYSLTFQAYNPSYSQISPNISMCVKSVVFVCYAVSKNLNDVLGVTRGAEPLYIIQPFQIREIYGSSNLAGALSNITVRLQTGINFAVQDSIYISGLDGAGISITETISIFDEDSSGSNYAFGYTAIYDGNAGILRLIVSHSLEGNHLYSFFFQLRNPTFLQQTYLTIHAISSVANVSSLTMSFSNATAPLSLNGIPNFYSISFGIPKAGEKSNITVQFSLGIDVGDGSYIYFSLPFNKSKEVSYPVYIRSNVNSLNITEIVWTSELSNSFLRFQIGLNNPFPSYVNQKITVESNFWIPASGFSANNSAFKMYIFSLSTNPFPVSSSPSILPLFNELYVNALSFSVQAYVPQFGENQVTLKSESDFASAGDEFLLVGDALACSTASLQQQVLETIDCVIGVDSKMPQIFSPTRDFYSTFKTSYRVSFSPTAVHLFGGSLQEILSQQQSNLALVSVSSLHHYQQTSTGMTAVPREVPKYFLAHVPLKAITVFAFRRIQAPQMKQEFRFK